MTSERDLNEPVEAILVDDDEATPPPDSPEPMRAGSSARA